MSGTVAPRWQRLRWRIADRLGRALVGGRLNAIDRALATAVADLQRAQTAGQHRLEEVATILQHAIEALRERDAALAAQLDAASAHLTEAISATRTQSADAATALHAALSTVTTRSDALDTTLAEVSTDLALHSRSIDWLAQRHTGADAPTVSDDTLISIIMPVWNRQSLVRTAVASIQAQTDRQWELVVVDDGSTDDTAAVLQALAHDPRIRVLRQSHGGAARARNLALGAARGGIITYLDSDNLWLPSYLATVRRMLATRPDIDCLYLAQIVDEVARERVYVRWQPFDRQRLLAGNFIDLNVFAHRPICTERYGGFDESLRRLEDWDLILRYTVEQPALGVPVVGGRYVTGHGKQMSNSNSYAFAYDAVRRKWQPPIARPLRVLYALWHFPQLSESYVRSEITGLQRLGVDITVCAQETGSSCASTVPIVYEPLADVIARLQPDIVHTHWMSLVERFRDVVAAANIPFTVRGHGFDFTDALLREVAADPVVRAIFVFPHQTAGCADAKIQPLAVSFDPALYPPAREKDPRLVMRTCAGLPSKELSLYLEIAQRCPTHRFVLIIARPASVPPDFIDGLVAANRAHGSRVEILIDRQPEEVARWIAAAGIYLHTHLTSEPVGMPISLAEAMATGCHVIARRLTPLMNYVGNAGAYYSTIDEAVAQIHATTAWTDAQWRAARSTAVERAYGHLTDRVLLPAVRDTWLALAAERDAERRPAPEDALAAAFP